MAIIYIGTSGYSFKDWVGNFYPENIKSGEMLSFYAQYFKIVEINSTYYVIPKPQSFEKMLSNVPPDFQFTVKANGGMTHEKPESVSVFDRFEEAIQPLVEANKMKGILAQFPPSFKNTQENRVYLNRFKDTLSEYPLIVEFRHSSWDKEPAFDFLKNLGIAYCSVDEPDLPGLMPSKAIATTNLGYIRFHGRNKKAWYGGDSSERYNYLYSDQELRCWIPKIKHISDNTEELLIFFNNCHAGHATRNALKMQDMLQSDLFKPNTDDRK
jgi:uncharacterized protein YecE (DUF72 family)